mmetsp:Transcript_49105/g.97574  ORF Transcript_49105/g.97574 Transcript_49105/m.97574 type:complete len:662 (+) Transcript_49105:70-2055(+)|eukprot:CAMPEP_0172712274 /NCGR_PEP_ID=MMETSP1074-20121228/60998_1 /TAXON_ID=2916 /ORGANISM="Ceratium fusus, Strain PA161109" /LENGTH=661 /DNA_ID=CAMNT_0013536177 /DNA_START=71 /DNA_END=2056 /DNA_ORIENTATION=-
MRTVVCALVLAVASAVELKLTWSDCGAGSTHAKITGFSPNTITTGQQTKLTGTGDLDEDVAAASFDLEMKTAAGTVSCKGDASQSKSCNLPLGVGKVTFDAVTFPLKKGSVSINVDLSLAAALPGFLARTDTTVKAASTSGDVLFCLEIKSGPSVDVHQDRKAQIQEIENTPGVLWKAVPHPRFASRAPGASKDLCGVKSNSTAVIKELVKNGEIEEFEPNANAAVPDDFDSEQNWPHCAKIIGDIRDQSNCGCCWAFAGAEAASDRMCIATDAAIVVPISAQDVCFNGGGFMSRGCNGGQISSPWSYMKKGGLFGGKGAVSGGQYQGSGPFGKGYCSDYSLPNCHHHGPQGNDPYPAEGEPGCPHANSPAGPKMCDADAKAPHNDFESDKYSYSGSTITASGESHIQQAIMQGGPMEVAFSVYSDFENYASGIYHHVSGEQVGGHAVKVVGWGVENGVKYWKIANSWNPYWGEKGYFRIRRGNNEGGIENQAIASSSTAKWSRAGDLAKEDQIQGGTLKLDWTDCGDSSYHGKVTDVEPKSLTIGTKTKITGSGTVDEAVSAGKFTITAKVGFLTEHYDGDVCAAKTFDLPLKLGSVTWEGLNCPAAAGKISVGVDVGLSSSIPSSLARSTISVKATGASNENLLCMSLKTSPEVATIVV